MKYMPEKNEIERILKSFPHVVILGAGASCACIPNGDKNGLKITAMNNFINKFGLDYLFKDIQLETKSNNLEEIYT